MCGLKACSMAALYGVRGRRFQEVYTAYTSYKQCLSKNVERFHPGFEPASLRVHSPFFQRLCKLHADFMSIVDL